ncbi:unnamed protein product [Cylindrotheca closterium]|uniref:Uncharacterized protein n=1 Tax=Cylindrotheca closterium TaxID=2856 RepID=A0AAD2CPF9_9STRA|nr:unnamed protein product [Cylindrotheca closterium]
MNYTHYNSTSYASLRSLRQLFLLLIISSYSHCVLAANIGRGTYHFLHCYSADDDLLLKEGEEGSPTSFHNDTTVNDNNASSLIHRSSSIVNNNDTTITIVYPGDRLVLPKYDPPQTVSLYATNDCAEFDNESLAIYSNVYRIRSGYINMNITFVCQQDIRAASSFGCNYTMARTFSVQPTPPRSWPIEHPDLFGSVDPGLFFLLFTLALTTLFLAMQWCINCSENQKERAAEEIAWGITNDVNGDVDGHI